MAAEFKMAVKIISQKFFFNLTYIYLKCTFLTLKFIENTIEAIKEARK
jgi:uncharacterized Fe-S cluster-containing MiaB family protein